MAFLQPENIPSRNDVPQRVQTIARALRDLLPDDVTVWLERTGDGDAAALRREFAPESAAPVSATSEPYLVVLDPCAGIAVLEAPSASRTRRHLRRNRESEVDQLRPDIARRSAELRHGLHVGSARSLPVIHVLAFPELRREDLPTSASLRILSEEDFTPDTFRPALQRLLRSRIRPLSEQEETAVRATVEPDIVIGGASQQGSMFLTTDDTETIRALDREQERLARNLGGGYRLIRGVAGSGKTLVLTHLAKHFGELLPTWRILLLCFNRALSHALAAEVKIAANVQTRTLDGLAYGMIEDAGRPIRHDKNPDFEERRREALEIAGTLEDSDRFDMVLVDEAQDLGASGLDLAWAMLKSNRDHFVIALDSAQKVYRRRMTWNPPGMTARGRSTVLRTNYRNTREILDPALEILRLPGNARSDDPDSDDLDILVTPEEAVRHGVASAIVACSDLGGEVGYIAERVRQLREAGSAAEDIVVLSGSADLRVATLARIPDAIDAQECKDKGAVARGKVRIATLQLLKGLEFCHVIVGGANDVWVPDDEEKAQDEQRRRLLYVAMTRATESLTVTYSGDGVMNSLQQLPRWNPEGGTVRSGG